MLNVKLINDLPQLNAWFYITSVTYIPGETVKITFQFQELDSNIRYIPGTSATCNVSFKVNDGTTLVKAATMLFSPDDRSIWQVNLSSAESLTIVGNNFLAALDVLGDATNIQQAIGNNMLSITLFDGEC